MSSCSGTFFDGRLCSFCEPQNRSKSKVFFFQVLDVGVIGQASGSAYVEQGNTKVICGVYGPREIPRRSDFSMKSGILACKLEQAPFSNPKRVGRSRQQQEAQESEAREISSSIKEALEATVCMVSTV